MCWTHLQIVESVRKGIAFREMLQYVLNTSTNVFVSTVLGEKSSDVEQSWGASAHQHTR